MGSHAQLCNERRTYGADAGASCRAVRVHSRYPAGHEDTVCACCHCPLVLGCASAGRKTKLARRMCSHQAGMRLRAAQAPHLRPLLRHRSRRRVTPPHRQCARVLVENDGGSRPSRSLAGAPCPAAAVRAGKCALAVESAMCGSWALDQVARTLITSRSAQPRSLHPALLRGRWPERCGRAERGVLKIAWVSIVSHLPVGCRTRTGPSR